MKKHRKQKSKKHNHHFAIPRLLVASVDGEIVDCPEYAMLGSAGTEPELPEYLIPLPEGSTLYFLPGRSPVGFDEKKGTAIPLKSYLGEPVQAVAAFVAPAYTQLLRPAYHSTDNAPLLPLFAYTAVGWKDDMFWVPAVRIDKSKRQDIKEFNEKKVLAGAENLLKKYTGNRLVKHLIENCCRKYKCPAARNFALERWEMPVPISRSCNSRCLGCISFQSAEKICAPQERISFTPSPEEIAEIVIPHFENAEEPIASFGQGCEGEPITEWKTIEEAVTLIRKKTKKGIINLNTNASYPDRINKLLEAGVDSIRVSLNSTRRDYYERYFKPADYSFDDVIKSIQIARESKKWVSLNYFVFPGFTDQEAEWEEMRKLLNSPGVDMIQWRNLNIDPDWYIKELQIDLSAPKTGVLNLINKIKKEFPNVKSGYFNMFAVHKT